MNVDQLARDEPPDLVRRRQAWKNDYPWLDQAFKEAGPGAAAASDGWRVRIEDELRATLDFKVRPDGTAAVWCGMSAYDFHHDPTTNELFEGLADAYRRELKRRRQQSSHSAGQAGRAPGRPSPYVSAVRALPPLAADSLSRILRAILLARAADLVLIFLGVTAFTLILSAVAIVVG